MLFSDELITLEADEIAQSETYDEESLHMRQLLKTKQGEMTPVHLDVELNIKNVEQTIDAKRYQKQIKFIQRTISFR